MPTDEYHCATDLTLRVPRELQAWRFHRVPRLRVGVRAEIGEARFQTGAASHVSEGILRCYGAFCCHNHVVDSV